MSAGRNLSVVLVAVVVCAGAWAQDGCLNGARIDGLVTDSTGAALPAASVRVSDTLLTTSDSSGHFRVACAPVGVAVVTVQAQGFESRTVNVQTRLGHSAVTTIQLPVASVQQDVEVHADAGSAGPGVTVLNATQIEGMADDPDDFLRQLQVLGSQSGGGAGSTLIRVDGFQNGSALPPKSAIASIRLNPDLFSSEYQFPPYSGAQIEITTKPGADRLHGGLFYSDSDGSFNATDSFSTVATPAGKRRYGFEVTGPIRSKKSGFALALEKRDIDEFNVVNAVTLGASGNQTSFQQAVSAPQRLWIGSVRGDWQVTPKDVAVLSFSANVNHLENQGVGGLTMAEAGYASLVSEYALRLTNTQTLSPTAAHESRVGYSWKRTTETPLSAAPSVQVAGSFTGGGSIAGNLNNRERDLEIDDDLLLTHGRDDWKLGLQSLGVMVHAVDPSTFNGAYVFGGGSAAALDSKNAPTGQTTSISGLEQYRRALKNLSGGTATTYQVASGSVLVPFTEWRLALYAEDTVKLTRQLTISAGLRYALQTNPGNAANFGPRLSLSWSPDKKQAWVFHVRAGLFESPTDTPVVAEVTRLNGTQRQEFTTYSAPYTANAATPPLTGLLRVSTVNQFSPSLVQNSTYNAVVHLEHQFLHYWQISPGVFWGEDWNTLRVRNINAPMVASSVGSLPDAAASLQAPRPFAANENMLQYQNSGHLTGNLVSMAVSEHGYKRLDLSAWYGHFHFKSNTSDQGGVTSPQSSYSDAGESARVDWSTAHKLSLQGSLNLPYKIAVAIILDASSGRAYNLTTGTDNNGDGNFNDRPAYASTPGAGVYSTRFGLLTTNTTNGSVPRNLGTMPALIHLDLNVNHVFTLNPKDKDHVRTLTLNARSANLINHTNVTAVGSVISSPNFSRPVSAETARRFELGARFTF